MVDDSLSRFAVISDIHGNSDALAAVLADIDSLGIQTIINLGDNFSGPLAPKETAELLIARDTLGIQGNHDRAITEKIDKNLGPSDRWALEQLSTDHLKWLSALPATRVVANDIFLCHGTPSSDSIYWLEEVQDDGIVSLRSKENILKEAIGLRHSILLCGHSHVARIIAPDERRLIINPGSVGQPAFTSDWPKRHRIETGSSQASYAIIERRRAGVSVSLRKVPYDFTRMAILALDAGRKDWSNALRFGWLDGCIH